MTLYSKVLDNPRSAPQIGLDHRWRALCPTWFSSSTPCRPPRLASTTAGGPSVPPGSVPLPPAGGPPDRGLRPQVVGGAPRGLQPDRRRRGLRDDRRHDAPRVAVGPAGRRRPPAAAPRGRGHRAPPGPPASRCRPRGAAAPRRCACCSAAPSSTASSPISATSWGLSPRSPCTGCGEPTRTGRGRCSSVRDSHSPSASPSFRSRWTESAWRFGCSGASSAESRPPALASTGLAQGRRLRMSITRVLIANRGEIALRIIRACHAEGLEAVAVYSEADASSPHVRAADLAVPIGPAPPGRSYLRIEALIRAARTAGAQAVHPGYGFLSERAAFAEAVEREHLIFVGPPASAIRAMGDKTEARRRMRAAGVPVVPGGTTPITDSGQALEEARRLGFPVMVKAAAGGGGRGMRIVGDASGLPAALETAASEALAAFGDGAAYLEKYLDRPRHVESQILADFEKTIPLGERECSIQRRHQKVLEEAPSIAVSPQLRREIGQAALAAAVAVGYRGAGTCEFLLAADGSFYFLEMNTRIQVEHPVTEMVYDVDLVREQLRIARGMPMTVSEWPLSPRGHAIECRITSEDPANGFLPS